MAWSAGEFHDMEAALKKLLATALLATFSFPAAAPAQTSGQIMLAPGVYTTAVPPRRGQQSRAGGVGSPRADREGHSVFLACVQGLPGGATGAVAEALPPAPPPPLIEAPVALPAAYSGWYGG